MANETLIDSIESNLGRVEFSIGKLEVSVGRLKVAARECLDEWRSLVRFAWVLLAVWLLFLLLICSQAHAANCGQFFVKQQVAYVAPVYAAAYVQPQVYYQAGRDLELRAAVREALRAELPQALTQALTAPNVQQVRQQQTSRPSNGGSVIVELCMRCHQGANPKGGVTLDGRTPVNDHQFRRFAEMAGEGIDVPPEMKRVMDSLTPAQKGSIMSEMIAMRPEQQQPQPEQIPPAFTPADRPPPAPAPNGGLQ